MEKNYKTLTDLLNAPARESMAAIAVVAPAIERIARSSGIVDLLFSEDFLDAVSGKAKNEKERKQNAANRLAIGKEVTLRLMKYCLGDNIGDMQQIIAAVNGITVDELLDQYTMREIIEMIKAAVGDPGFLSSLRTLSE